MCQWTSGEARSLRPGCVCLDDAKLIGTLQPSPTGHPNDWELRVCQDRLCDSCTGVSIGRRSKRCHRRELAEPWLGCWTAESVGTTVNRAAGGHAVWETVLCQRPRGPFDSQGNIHCLYIYIYIYIYLDSAISAIT